MRRGSALSVQHFVRAFESVAGGLIVSAMSVGVVLFVLLAHALIPIGVGLLLMHPATSLVRGLATQASPAPLPPEREIPRGALACLELFWRDSQTRKELHWALWQAIVGLPIGVLALLLPVLALRDVSFPLWWWVVPTDYAYSSIGMRADSWLRAFAVGLLGLGWGAIAMAIIPSLNRFHQVIAERILWPQDPSQLYRRITVLQQTRSGVWQAHNDELRRIERALHDGAQSRLVASTIKIGSARRLLHKDPTRAENALDEAQTAVEAALNELRAVVRSIHPPALDSHDLAGAVHSLAAGCAVPCTVQIDGAAMPSPAVEDTAYHVIAEAVTNISKHSGATAAQVRMQFGQDILQIDIEDDGVGGANHTLGSGLMGIQRRVAAQDGHVTVSSPVGGPTRIHVELPCESS